MDALSEISLSLSSSVRCQSEKTQRGKRRRGEEKKMKEREKKLTAESVIFFHSAKGCIRRRPAGCVSVSGWRGGISRGREKEEEKEEGEAEEGRLSRAGAR